MSKRRDKRNRVLRSGESQRADGRYAFVYTDPFGRQKFLYSWKLEPTDPLPAGKRPCLSLREKEQEVAGSLADGVAPLGGGLTVLDLVEKYVAQKTGVRHNTQSGYSFVMNVLRREVFGTRRIDKVKLSDARAFLIKLQKEDGRGYSSIHVIRGVLRPAFQMAVEDDLLRKNPFQFALSTAVVNDSVTRVAISPEDEERFLEFVRQDNHYKRYYDGIYILFKTGVRISEFVGLTMRDIDLENGLIDINHQLQRKRDMQYVIEDTKTTSGTRVLPMTPDIKACFERIMQRPRPKIEPMIDGYTGFLYLDMNGQPHVALHWEHYFKFIREKYAKLYGDTLPYVSPHVCRHTYCTNMARAGMNPKTLQYLMGHADISITLNTYTHIGLEDAIKEVNRVSKFA